MVVVLAGIGLLAPAIFEDDHAAQTTSEFEGDFETFDSKAAFEKYVAQSEQRRDTTSLPGGEPSVRVTADRAVAETTDSSQQRAEGDAAGGGPETTFETRQTNVQEVGVGEPDIVKVTDEYTYYSQKPTYIRTDPRLSEDTASQPREPRSTTGGLRTIRTPNAPQRYITSTDELKITNTSHTTGQLLRTDTRLVVYNDSLVTGYDIRRDEKSKQWELPLNDSTSVMTTRRIDDIAYFVVRDRSATCPVQPVRRTLSLSVPIFIAHPHPLPTVKQYTRPLLSIYPMALSRMR